MSLGFGFTFTLAVDLVVAAAPPERAGAASAIAETGAEFGGALGLAILGSLGIAVYRLNLNASLPAGTPAEAVRAAQETLGGAVAAAAQLPTQAGAALLDAARQAFVQALHINAYIGVAGFVILVIVTMSMLRDLKPGEEENQEEEQTASNVTGQPLPDAISD
jgi:DHA2 family multidrug resistance protein-like MFS transporter